MSITQAYRFSNLDGLRFIAATLVVINHTEQISDILGLDSFIGYRGVEQIGKFGVMLFFTLSGFLITYLLLKEKSLTGTINIKAFYIRRILRIWPLYILIILLAFFAFHNIPLLDLRSGDKGIYFDNIGLKLLFYLLMLPNLVLLVFGPVPFASQTWSIGSEEQFYLIWPILLKRINISVLSLLLVIISYHLFLYIFQNYVRSNIYREYCVALMQTVPLDLMALGGIAAVLVYTKSKIYDSINLILSNNLVQASFLIALSLLLFTGYRFTYFNHFLYGLLLSALVFIICREQKNTILESRLFSFGGKISYGIYMWHAPVVTLVLKSLLFFGWYSKVFAYPIIVCLTLFVSWLSFRFIESPFLNLKDRFTIVR
jgi:peptidoglycan/LPS O-acetylase OafA/YrhL